MTEESHLICDYCGKKEKVRDFALRDLPKDWYALAYHKGSFLAVDDWRITHHFCCADHIDKGIKIVKLATPKE